MSIAFGQFHEPFAWLIRGLIEYGWEDLSLSPSKYPTQSGRGFDCNPFLRSRGRDGLLLTVMAIDAEGTWDEADKIYRFSVKLGSDDWNRPAFSLRSVDTGFQATYPFDQNNPLYAAGYINQGIGEHIPRFMSRKRAGHRLSESQINELKNINGTEASSELIHFLSQRLQYQQSMNSALSEGLWYSNYHQPAQEPAQHVREPPQTAPSLEEEIHYEAQQTAQKAMPAITSGEGRGFRIAGKGSKGQIKTANSSRAQALDEVKTPSLALKGMSFMGFLFGGLALINAILTQLMIANNDTVRSVESYKPIVMSSLVLGLLAIIGGFFALKGAAHYRDLKQSKLAVFSIIYAGAIPFCWPMGLPIAIWTGLIWKKPSVKQARMG